MPTQDWIRALLKSKGYKLKDVAETLDISAPRVTDILKGAREVQADEVLPLASLLGLTAEALLESLKTGALVEMPSSTGFDTKLPVKGFLMGDGRLEPMGAHEGPREVMVPADAETSDGLMAFILDDAVLEQEIPAGSLIIAGDPRIHHYPMVPETLFLVRRRQAGANSEADGEDLLAPRQLHRTDTGEDWMVPLTNRPNPAFQSWRFIMTPAPAYDQSSPKSGYASDVGDKSHRETGDQRPVYTDDIVAAIMWVHRYYKPKEGA